MSEGVPRERFRSSFERWSRRVRAHLWLRRVLTGAAWASGLGALVAAAFWFGAERAPTLAVLRPWTGVAGLVGAMVGVYVARARRWSDRDVALFIDGRLKADETVATAVELEGPSAAHDTVARQTVVRQAEAVLARATRRSLRPPLWSPPQLLLPLGAAAIAYVSWIPAPVAPAAEAAEPGEEMVQLADIAGLEKVMALSELDARDEDQRKRFDALADRAAELRDRIRAGMPKREAQAEIAKLRDDLLAERMSLGEGDRAKGLEAALGKLGENPDLEKASRALGDRDLVAFDHEMQKLANQLEADSRERAQAQLEEAAKAAEKAGNQGLAKELEEQKKKLEDRGEAADDLRDLADALGESLDEEGKKALEDFEGGDPEAGRRLADALRESLGKLSDEEKERLKENLQKRLDAQRDAGKDGAGQTPDLEDLADKLDTPEGQRALEEMLKQMAQEPAPGGESQRQQGLDDAQRGAGEAQGQLGTPVPIAGGASSPNSGDAGKTPGSPNGGDEKGGQGGPGKGSSPSVPKKGDPKPTASVGGDGITSHAPTPLNPGALMPGSIVGRTTGRPGETANLVGSGALGAVGPGEVGAVDRSEVPEEYREQVGRYFEP